MDRVIAEIKDGTFCRPGISLNRRWYKPEHIRAAAEEAQALIDSGDGPTVFSMMTGHGARDPKLGDVTKTSGQLTKTWVDEQGNGRYNAEVLNTTVGRDLAVLLTGDKPALKSVSQATRWKSPPRIVQGPDGYPCETSANGFTLLGVDFTHDPGVPGSNTGDVEMVESQIGDMLFESFEQEDVIVDPVEGVTGEQAEKKPVFADPGYHNGAKALPITESAEIRDTWLSLHTPKIAEAYTANQIGRMKTKTQKAGLKAGFDLIAETNALGADVLDSLEAYTSVSIDNGPADLRISAWIQDPAKLVIATQRVAAAALAALSTLDPDNDGDIDGVTDDDDELTCPSCEADVLVGSLYCPLCGTAIPVAEAAPADKEGDSMEITQEALDEMLAKAAQTGAKTALEAAGVKPTGETVEETPELKAARELLAKPDIVAAANLVAEAQAKTPPTPETPAAPVTGETAPAGYIKLEDAKAAFVESAKTLVTEATEGIRAEAVEAIRQNGPRRRGQVPKHILEEAPEDVYAVEGEEGMPNLSKASTRDLANLSDKVFADLLTA
jgi:hypothetical protein